MPLTYLKEIERHEDVTLEEAFEISKEIKKAAKVMICPVVQEIEILPTNQFTVVAYEEITTD